MRMYCSSCNQPVEHPVASAAIQYCPNCGVVFGGWTSTETATPRTAKYIMCPVCGMSVQAVGGHKVNCVIDQLERELVDVGKWAETYFKKWQQAEQRLAEVRRDHE